VESSAISSIGYEGKKSILEIEFINHQVWQYLDVPNPVWYKFKSAASMGKYFNTHIRGKYVEIRIL
jgi:hypothetical protein